MVPEEAVADSIRTGRALAGASSAEEEVRSIRTGPRTWGSGAEEAV
jgi:hypothetical protein